MDEEERGLLLSGGILKKLAPLRGVHGGLFHGLPFMRLIAGIEFAQTRLRGKMPLLGDDKSYSRARISRTTAVRARKTTIMRWKSS